MSLPHSRRSAAARIFMGFIIFWAVCALIGLAGMLLTRWLSSRPEPAAEASTEEINAEISEAFVERHELTFMLKSEYFPPLLEALHLAVDGGFEQRQIDTLLHRLEAHAPFRRCNATYAVDHAGIASDIDFFWARDGADNIEMTLVAVPPLIKVARTRLGELPAAIEQ